MSRDNNAPHRRMLIEAMTAASNLVSEDMRRDFLVIGGAALVRYGSTRRTRDIAITAKTLDAFMEKAGMDSRFRMHPDASWTYTCQGEGIENVVVEIEFLDIGGEFVPKLHGMTKFDAVYVASLADIALMKAHAYQDREKADDLEDLNFAFSMMVRRGEMFTRYRFKQSEIEVISEVVETKGDAEAKRLLMQVARTVL